MTLTALEHVAAMAIASTLYFESADQSHMGKMCAASVMWTEHQRSGRTWEQVVKNPKRYSCWHWTNKLHRISMRLSLRLHEPMAMKAWADCWQIAVEMVEGCFFPVAEFTNYCRVDCDVAWKSKMTNKVVVDDHVYGVLI